MIYVGERGGKFAGLTKGQKDIDHIHTVFAGKFRRYHGESWLQRLLDVKTNLLNLRDLFYIIFGGVQSLFLVRSLKPDVVFLKGGFVGMPIGLASAAWRIPFVTHDSDALPGLANRMVSRWARWHATGMPADFYSYPKDSIKYTGVLVGESYQKVNEHAQRQYKRDLQLPEAAPLLLITGGSLGAQALNQAVRSIVRKLLDDYPKLHVVHQVGKGKTGIYDGFGHNRLEVLEFLQPMYKYSGAADVVVTRAGANTLAELAVQGKACVVVPNPWLTGGHQLENAKHLEGKEAVVTVGEAVLEKDPAVLDQAIRSLLDDPKKRHDLVQKLQTLAIPDAAERLAMVLLDTANHPTQKHAPQKTNNNSQ